MKNIAAPANVAELTAEASSNSPVLGTTKAAIAEIRNVSARYENDRSLSTDIMDVAKLIDAGRFCEHAASVLPAQNA